MEPESGVSKAPNKDKRVVLPLPEGPKITNSPVLGKDNEISFKTDISLLFRILKLLLIDFTSSIRNHSHSLSMKDLHY